tara:strand:- start:104 stop:376 length:273 start_codon:yes stop_codon:yes gene_type:complete
MLLTAQPSPLVSLATIFGLVVYPPIHTVNHYVAFPKVSYQGFDLFAKQINIPLIPSGTSTCHVKTDGRYLALCMNVLLSFHLFSPFSFVL